MMHLKRLLLILPLLALLIAPGCRKRPDFFVERGVLDFSADTVKFDSIFTNLPSPTERLTFVNNSGQNILIKEISLESGNEFDLIINGVQGDRQTDFELPDGDSAVAFVSFKSGQKDVFARDRLLFRVGDNTQRVEIEAFVFDAISYRDSVLGLDGNTTTILGPDKLHLIDGYIYVPDGHTLIIQAGTQLFFTPRLDANFNLLSSIVVYGRLLVQGVEGNEVVFQGSRFGEDYEETPGQWRGIAFGNLARASKIEHAIIKNGFIGVYQEYGNPGIGPKVLIEETEIRNMSAFGIYSNGFVDPIPTYPMIRINNSLIHNSATANLGIFGGGKYDFNQCTFANYTVDFRRNSPQIVINNYDDSQGGIIYNCRALFRNCIVWGTEEDEFAADSFPVPNQWDVFFYNTIIRTTLPLKGSNIVSSQDDDFIKFVDPTAGEPDERNYRLQLPSPGVNIGQVLTGLGNDLDERTRDAQPDAGCYEYGD
jgi:hypothetical protein